MGKSNHSYNKLQKVYYREKKLNHFFTEFQIEKLENINSIFVKRFKRDLSNFIKNTVQLVSYSMNIESFDSIIKSIKQYSYFNSIKSLDNKNEFFITFSYDFFSVIIECLFGGFNSFKYTIRKNEITHTEHTINKKIIKLILNAYQYILKKYINLEVSLTDIQIFFNYDKTHSESDKIFLINCFHFNINNTEVFFDVLIPYSLVKKINKELDFNNKDQNDISENIQDKIVLDDICKVELDITAQILLDTSISYDKACSFSVGDVISIKKPNKIIGLIENKPIFFGDCKRFNEQIVIFIEEFIELHLDSNKNKEYSNE